MLELLKKIGLPATVSAVIAALVTITPFLFKIDERYAKTEELAATAATTARQIQDLTVEVSKLAGVQQTMLALMAQGERIRAEAVRPQPAPIVDPGPAEQARPALRASPPPIARIEVPAKPASAVDFNAVPPSNAGASAKPEKVERAMRFDEVSRELQRSQQRLQEIQKY